MRKVTLGNVARILRERDNILILTHQCPDGDTLGSAYALCAALQSMGKQARVVCSDEIPAKYKFLQKGVKNQAFAPGLILAVDVADAKLLGKNLSQYADRVELAVDHHKSNTFFAENTYVDTKASAVCEIIYELLMMLEVGFTTEIAICIYTGITTDTGCFMYSNVTQKTHRIAALMMGLNVKAAEINRIMFGTKSRARMEIEREALDNLAYHFDGRCALITITKEMLSRTGVDESDIEGLTSLPRQIEGVKVALTLRELGDGQWKYSVRTMPEVDAAALCGNFGGGGHKEAAGCHYTGTMDEAKNAMLACVGEVLGV